MFAIFSHSLSRFLVKSLSLSSDLSICCVLWVSLKQSSSHSGSSNHGIIQWPCLYTESWASLCGELCRRKTPLLPLRSGDPTWDVHKSQSSCVISLPHTNHYCVLEYFFGKCSWMLFNLSIQSHCSEFMAGFRIQLMHTSLLSHPVAGCDNIMLFGKLT